MEVCFRLQKGDTVTHEDKVYVAIKDITSSINAPGSDSANWKEKTGKK